MLTAGGAGDSTANINLLGVLTPVAGTATTRFILDSDGDSHQDVGTAWTNFDAEDDMALMNSLAIGIARRNDPLREQFAKSLAKHRSLIEALPGKAIATWDENGNPFVNMSRLSMLHHGAIRQIGDRLMPLEERVVTLQGWAKGVDTLQGRVAVLERENVELRRALMERRN